LFATNYQVSISALTQRAGRAARNPLLFGKAIFFVPKAILEAVPEHWQTGWDTAEPGDPSEWADDVGSDDDDDDSPNVIPVSKMRRLDRFGLPVTEDTRSKVSDFIRNIYSEAKNLKDAARFAKHEIKGTRKAKLTAAQKVDPAVLWVLCTVGCRRRAMLSIYKDENTFSDNHRSWCCDRCAKQLMSRLGFLPNQLRQHLTSDRRLLETSAAFLGTDPKSHKIILLENKDIINQQASIFELSRLPVNGVRKIKLKKRLEAVRESILLRIGVSSLITPEMVMPDAVIEHILKAIRKINSPKSLEQSFRAAHFDLDCSLIPGGTASIPSLYNFINNALSDSAHLEASMRAVKVIADCRATRAFESNTSCASINSHRISAQDLPPQAFVSPCDQTKSGRCQCFL